MIQGTVLGKLSKLYFQGPAPIRTVSASPTCKHGTPRAPLDAAEGRFTHVSLRRRRPARGGRTQHLGPWGQGKPRRAQLGPRAAFLHNTRYLKPRVHRHKLLLSPQAVVHGLGEDEPHRALECKRDEAGQVANAGGSSEPGPPRPRGGGGG